MDFQQERRIQQSILATLERRTLIGMATRLPAWVTSDRLTALAALAMAGAATGYALVAWTPLGLMLASICLVVNWFGDSLDGTLARVRQQQRPRYGYYVDHVVDVVGVLLLFVGLGLSGLMHPALAAALLVAYYLVSLEVYLATHSLGEFRMTFAGFGPTELRLVLIAGNTILFAHPVPDVAGTGLSPFDIGAIVATAGLLGIFVTSVVTNTRRLYRMEPLPERVTNGTAGELSGATPARRANFVQRAATRRS